MPSELNPLVKSGVELPVMEQFYTIQGEGAHTGTPAYFIRLAGCDVGCVWCDVKESWHTQGYPVINVENLAAEAEKSGARVVVVTGGEPTLYPLDKLTQELIRLNLRTHLETSGTNPISGNWHWVCFSPKKFKKPVDEAYEKACELKIVIFNKHDFEWAETHAERVGKKCLLYLQPEWSKAEEMMPLITDYVKKNPHWKISLQTHKYMGIP